MNAADARKVYRGVRDRNGICLIEVTPPGAEVGYPLPHRMIHSPTGFEWGYGGSGPADTARSILADYLGFVPAASIYQRFKFLIVAALPSEFAIDSDDIETALTIIRAETNVRCLRCRDRGLVESTEDGRSRPTVIYCNCETGEQMRAEVEDQ